MTPQPLTQDQKQEKIKETIKKQLTNLVDQEIGSIFKNAEAFFKDERNFGVGFKVNIEYSGLEAKIETTISVPRLPIKTSCIPDSLNFRTDQLL